MLTVNPIKRLVLILILMFGCGSEIANPDDYFKLNHQEEATTIVWYDVFHATVHPPAIRWVEGGLDVLNCSNGRGWIHTYHNNPPICVGGLYLSETNLAEVAWYSGAKFSTTAFAHELCHSWDYVINRYDGYEHNPPCFGPGGMVEQADAKLRDQGL